MTPLWMAAMAALLSALDALAALLCAALTPWGDDDPCDTKEKDADDADAGRGDPKC